MSTTRRDRREKDHELRSDLRRVRYPLADAVAAHGLEDDIRGIFADNGNGGFVGFVSQNSTVRLLITPATPIAIRGSDEPNPTVVHRW